MLKRALLGGLAGAILSTTAFANNAYVGLGVGLTGLHAKTTITDSSSVDYGNNGCFISLR